MLTMRRRALAQTDRGFYVHDRSGRRGGWLPGGRQQRADVVLGGHSWQAFEHVCEAAGVPPAKPPEKSEESPSFSRPKPLSLRLENGFLQHSNRA